MRLLVVAVLSIGGAIGCGARSGLASLEAPAAIDAGTDGVDSAIVVVRDTGFDVRDARDESDVPVVPSACQPQIDALTAKIVPATGSCTTIVRMSRATGAIKGYRMICGGYGASDEASAAKQAQSETGVGFTGCFMLKSITGSKPPDDYVFFQPASAAACACCGDGWLTAVSARNGLTLLGGEISFGDGRGLVFPKSFDDARELGASCGSRLPLPSVRGFDLTKMGAPGMVPPPLSGPVMDSLLRTIWSTALPDALARKHYIFDAVVLLYAPRATAPTEAEWLVLIDSGWLE